MKFDYTDNYELINKYNEFIKGEIIFNNNLYHIINKKINNIILAGGCFWCSALPFYQKKNIINVICGYTGGKMHMPKYEDVKKKITGHKEAMLIYYDISDISFDEIISTYLNSIDPFDDGGQFMDRGSNYTLGAYFNDEEEINKFKNILKEKEEIWQKKAMIDISYQNIFYKAEEEHQEFYKKNPKRMELEFKEREKYKKSYDI